MRQQNLFSINWRHQYCSGGKLRNKRAGRKARPLSTRDPHHVVLKSRYRFLRQPKAFRLIQLLVWKYAGKFYIKVEQISIQHDHIHLQVRAGRRSHFQSFFRVLAGQIAQQVTDTVSKKMAEGKLWKYRPFTRVVKGWKAYQTLRNYIQLNEKEAKGEVPYRKQRLKGLTVEQLQSLWT